MPSPLKRMSKKERDAAYVKQPYTDFGTGLVDDKKQQKIQDNLYMEEVFHHI